MTDEQIMALWNECRVNGDFTVSAAALAFARKLLATPAPLSDEPVAWVYCDTLHAEHCHLSDRDAIEDGWLPLIYANHAGFARADIQELAVKHGFQYWRASDAHGVNGTIKEAEELLADLLGVEVEIGGSKAQALITAPPATPSDKQEAWAFRSDGQLWVVRSRAVAMRWQEQGFEVTPVEAAPLAQSAESADRRAEYWKSEHLAANEEIKRLQALLAQSAEQDRIDARKLCERLFDVAREATFGNDPTQAEFDTWCRVRAVMRDTIETELAAIKGASK